MHRSHSGRNRIVVSTLRCGRRNPGSNPGYGIDLFFTTTRRLSRMRNNERSNFFSQSIV